IGTEGNDQAVHFMKKRDKYKPAVTKSVLLFLAGAVWGCVGAMLLFLAFSWLNQVPDTNMYSFGGVGIVLALLVHHFGFLKIADRNLERILPMVGKKCLFSFMPWKSYLVIVIMIAVGAILRHSVIPKQYLAILYIGIGLALILSSVRYMRFFLRENRK
ncbi:MAG: hypothetical protein ACOWYE_07410, partial [Desulfatiglandales bacterium]